MGWPWSTGGLLRQKQKSREIKSRIAVERAAVNKKTLFNSKLDITLRKKLVKW